MIGELQHVDKNNEVGRDITGYISGSLNPKMLKIEGSTASVSENSNATVSFTSTFNTNPMVTVTPVGSSGSTGIGTDLHIISTSTSSFTVRIPDNCSTIMWIAIGW